MMVCKSITKSDSDLLLNERGFNLIKDYSELIVEAEFPVNSIVLDVATGTGRAAAILSRIVQKVITGDYDFTLKSESEKRITDKFINKVLYVKLNLEKIPFPDNSIENIVCINTIHELQNPLTCLSEIIRIHSTKGKLLLSDFNTKGFNIMDELHKIQYGKVHTRGKISYDEIEDFVTQQYDVKKMINKDLNFGLILSGKKNDQTY